MIPPSLVSQLQVLALVWIFMPFKEPFPILSTAHMLSVWCAFILLHRNNFLFLYSLLIQEYFT